MNHDTICALATANGIGAIGIIRISGDDAISVSSKIFDGKNLEKAASHTVHYGFIKDDEEIIDEVMVSVFKAPKTFTAEDSVEISFHGSPHIAKKILEVLIKNGARMAKAGEFTMRAFINGRIDLSQAESIADLIASENESSRKVALTQLKGGITNEISFLRTDLLNFVSLIELELDFAEEDVEFADRSALNQLLDKIESKLNSLIESFQYGNAIKNGTAVAIIGKPNAGKSTLLNALLKEERAIVSNIAGTTRDTIEEILHIKGHAFRLIDTAGLRDTVDEIEAIGVKKAKEKVANANILVYLIDAQSENLDEDFQLIQELERNNLYTIVCITKADLDKEGFDSSNLLINLISTLKNEVALLNISAKENWNIEQLRNELFSYVEQLQSEEGNVVITNQRHYEALGKSLAAVDKVKEAITTQISTELLAYELRNALEHLGEISGEVTNDEVLGNIFSKFCIGK
ncbi:tRNA uridine-5-carboxymethylaminomethyl(34) synthesis GTPase MnmE [Chryseobacterium wangxinyae]|uniref:tRNA uridine-5-carboxymethylaminomethyl(34) synthesis GTPase MnmE n=1 Tax=Chryseobacterium sp. CY353 TaxID=2997334 RepID=UPI00226FAA92|nr:tRNA uridine-5-carboxymethylaminomethyl(34) synthesis GTPase MnmE [Chryseobacterium sp. CY353]MCY0971047.1 tRNA uridine-5-carboxymethylaminomethyl(34) synthesis GTPase MnmE [Chryseobacterium sp. CY353]